jgi:peptidyl-prolyl cis-trans isomerase C
MKHTLIRTASEGTDTFSGCSRGPAPAARRANNAPPIFVNGVAIPESAIAQEAQNHSAQSGAEARAAAARALVIRELLLQRAKALGLAPAPERDAEGREEIEAEALARAVLEREAPAPEPDDAECRRLYEISLSRFTAPELMEASHILFAGDDAKQQAVDAIDAIRAGEDFAALARRCSACPSGQVGGSLGQLQAGDLAPAIEAVLAELQPGAVAPEPVRTRHGWHVVRLDRRIPARVAPYEAAAPALRETLRARGAMAAAARYIARLAEHAEIEGLSLSLGART